MGIRDFFRRKKGPEKPPEEAAPADVRIDEVHDWVNQTLSGKIKDRHDKANELYSDVMKSFVKIKESANSLEQSTFDSDEKIGSVVNMTKDLFVKRVNNLVNSLQGFQGKPVDFRVLKEFEQASAEALDDMASITPKQAFLLSTYFSKQSSAVIDSIKETQEKVSVMKEFLDAEGETIQLAHNINSKKDQQSMLKMRLSTVEKEESGIEMRIRELRNRTEKNLAEIDGIVKGHEYEQYNKMTEQIEKGRKKSAAMREKIVEELASAQRPLKKLEYLVSKGYPLAKEQEQILDGLINKPFETHQSSDEAKLKGVLLLVRKVYVEEKISLKDSERDRLDQIVASLDEDLKELKTEYAENEEEIKELERDKARYEWVMERKTHLENSIRRSLEEIASLEKVMEASSQDKDSIRKEMERQRRELEDILFKTSGKKVNILVPDEKEQQEEKKEPQSDTSS